MEEGMMCSKTNVSKQISWCMKSVNATDCARCAPILQVAQIGVPLYSITSMARTRMARLLWMIRTRFLVPRKFFRQVKKTNILGF